MDPAPQTLLSAASGCLRARKNWISYPQFNVTGSESKKILLMAAVQRRQLKIAASKAKKIHFPLQQGR